MNMRRLVFWGLMMAVSLALSWYWWEPQDTHRAELDTTADSLLSAENELFAKVLKPRAFIFLQDHGPIPHTVLSGGILPVIYKRI